MFSRFIRHTKLINTFTPGSAALQIRLLVRDFGSIDVHEPHVVSARVET